MSSATNATVFAGTTEAPAPRSAPEPGAPPAPPQPAAVSTVAAATAAAEINARIALSLLRRLTPHQPRGKVGEALPGEYRANPLRDG